MNILNHEKCSVIDGDLACDGLVFAAEMCQKHYKRNLTHGSPLVGGRTTANEGNCWADDGKCPNKAMRSGLCDKHYCAAKRNDGDPDIKIRHRAPLYATDADRPKCRECGEIAKAKGLCNLHYLREKAHGDASVTRKPRNANKIGENTWLASNGYVLRIVEGRKVMEHRYLAELALGRSLEKNETIHHRNTIRTDNSIGPCFNKEVCNCGHDQFHNLQLRITHQPVGGSVGDMVQYYKFCIEKHSSKEDLVKYAMEILQQYDSGKV